MKSAFNLFLAAACALPPAFADWRNIREGRVIPTRTYADQPYVVKTDDGAWLVCVTTGAGREGQPGQHVITMRSTDQGRTWSAPVEVEPAGGPEASYAVMLKVPSGRIYIFYNHNTDNIRKVAADNPPYRDGFNYRVDTLGHFVFRYSDDHGRTWSAKRYEVPVRDFEIDRRNPYGGRIKFFWTVGRPFVLGQAGYVPLHKVGGFGEGYITSSEGVLLRSANILTEPDPGKIVWETLPEGDIGQRTPEGIGGPVAEEHSYSVLSDGSLFCVYRTIDGHPVATYSRDGGRTWEPPQYLRYDDGRLVKHPRAANFAWRCSNGKFLYWFHNHGGRFIREHPERRTIAYEDRNPVWILGGIEADSPRGKIIRWSQPEILLYDDDPMIRISYPDLVEDGGRYYFTETQKETGRVHEVDASLLDALWSQFDNRTPARDGLLAEARGEVPARLPLPALPAFLRRSSRADYGTDDLRAGFSVDLRVSFDSLEPGQVIVDNRRQDGTGFAVLTAEKGTVELILNDGRTENRLRSEPGWLTAGKVHSLTAIVDGGPKVMWWVIDGRFCDGGDSRQFGWARFNPHFQSPQGEPALRIGPNLKGRVTGVRIYGRALRTSEAIGNHRADGTL